MFHPNFVTFTNTDIVAREPLNGKFKGNQNNGFTYVTFTDGSGGLIKNMKDWVGNKTGRLYRAEILTAQEYLAARVGKAMNAPIRDCLVIESNKVVMPYIIGETFAELDKEMPLGTAQATVLALFDYLVANADRRPKNLIQTPDKRIVGIDHALCNFRPREASPELIAEFWNNGVSHEALLILKPKLQNLAIDFHQLGMGDKHETMMANLSQLINAFQILTQYAVITKGDLPGHAFHGNQWTNAGTSDFFGKTFHHADITMSDGTILHATAMPHVDGGTFAEVSGEKNGYTIEHTSTDGGYGQTNYQVVARDGDGEAVGTLSYSVEQSDKIPHIQMVETEPRAQGKGLATAMYQVMAANNPKATPDPGMLTDDGAAWWNSPEMQQAKSEVSGLTEYKPIAKGDVLGHPFHGNQWVDGTGVLDEISPHRMKYLTELYIGTFRYTPTSLHPLFPAAMEDEARQQAFAFEMHERLSGKTLPDSDSGTAKMYRLDDDGKEIARGAVDDVDDFMKGISQFATPTGGTIARGLKDPTGEIVKSFVEGSTVDLPIASWANRMGGGKPLDEAASWGDDIVLVVDNPETKAFATSDVVSTFPQTLTGGRFSVDKIVDSVSGYSGLPVKTVFLTQQEFYAKAARLGWKQSDPNFWPNWFPDDFDPNPAFTEIAFAPVQKGDVDGHPFHGNQWTDGISFHSFDAAKKWFSERNIKLDTKAIEANGGLPSDIARVANQITNIEKKFPNSLDLLASITAQAPDERRAWLARVGPAADKSQRELQLSPKFFAISQNNDVLEKMLQERADAGKPPYNIARNADDIVTHELAHVFQNSISRGLENEPRATIWQGANRLWSGKVPPNFYDDSVWGDGERSASIFERAAHIAGYVKADGEPKTQLAKDISPYALTKPSEMWGEVFALFQRPDGISTLPKGAQERITKFQTAVNELAGSVILKGIQQDAGDVTCDMGFPDEFWTQFNELVKTKSQIHKGDVKGHEFHGNQYVSGYSSGEQPRKWAKSIIKSLKNGKRPIISAKELSILLKQASKVDPTKVATVDITELRINGTALMGEDGLGIPREDMPQIPGRMREKFIADIGAEGITSTRELVDPTTLQPSQKEIGLGRASELFMIADGEIPQGKAILVSQDDHVIDGHHNWAADIAIHLTDPTQMVPVIRVNAPALQVIARAQQWSKDNGIANKPLGKSMWERFTSILKGDVLGHPFHGNQYQDGEGGGAVPKNPRGTLTAPITGDEVRFSDQFTNAQKAAKTLIDQGQNGAELSDAGIRGDQKAAIAKDIAARLGDKFDDKLFTSWKDNGRELFAVDEGDRETNPTTRIEAREAGVSLLISQWAHTSNDTEPKSLAMQEAAKDEFGLKGTADWESSQSVKDETDALYAHTGDLYRAFLRAQYESTQEYLAKAGVTELGLYRGVRDITPEEATQLRPLSSWAYEVFQARTFSLGKEGLILAATVPADRVLSCARTGVGCLSEREVVVLGGENNNINITTAAASRSWVETPSGTYVMKSGGDYTGVNFSGAWLVNVDLTGANLEGANLEGANLTRANLTGANLTDAIGDNLTRLPSGYKVVDDFVVKA